MCVLFLCVFGPCFVIVLNILSSFTIILMRESELVALLWLLCLNHILDVVWLSECSVSLPHCAEC